MSLEDALQENTKAVNSLAALMSKSGGAAAASASTPEKRSPGRPKTVTLDEVKAIAEKVKEQIDRPTAVKLINDHGATSLAALDKSKYAQFIAAAEVLLSDGGGGEAGEGEANDEL